jgi:site-specific DNA-methyltransferase (adenine-specific)
MTPDCQVIHGDSLEILPTLAAGSVDCIVTDPPYGTGQWLRPRAGLGSKPKAAFGREAWDEWGTRWIDEVRRICIGPIAFFVPTCRLGDAIRYAESVGEDWRMMAWCKSDPMPMFTKQVAYGLEPVIVLRHKAAGGGKDWCEASTPRKGRDRDGNDHPHQKPLKVVSWIIHAVSEHGSLILDPFAGSGTTPLACVKSGRRCIAIESDLQYIPLIHRRLKGAETPLFQGLSVD